MVEVQRRAEERRREAVRAIDKPLHVSRPRGVRAVLVVVRAEVAEVLPSCLSKLSSHCCGVSPEIKPTQTQSVSASERAVALPVPSWHWSRLQAVPSPHPKNDPLTPLLGPHGCDTRCGCGGHHHYSGEGGVVVTTLSVLHFSERGRGHYFLWGEELLS